MTWMIYFDSLNSEMASVRWLFQNSMFCLPKPHTIFKKKAKKILVGFESYPQVKIGNCGAIKI